MAFTTFTASSAPCTFTLVPAMRASAVALPVRRMLTAPPVVTLPTLPLMAASATAPALA